MYQAPEQANIIYFLSIVIFLFSKENGKAIFFILQY